MKRHFTLSFLLSALISFSFAQTINDSVSLGSNSTHLSFYSLANGESANITSLNWDIQILTSVMSATIRANDAAGTQVYAPQNADTSNWATVDTTGMTPLYNSDTIWEIGSFNAQGNNYDDYGWGTYDFVSHTVTGTKIFVMKTVDGTFRKIWIKQLLAGNTFTLRVANLDNSNDTTFSFQKNAYSSKISFYYSFVSKSIKDIEPASGQWDLVFRRYVTELTPGFFYTVTGVLSNRNVTVAEARGVDLNIINENDTILSYSENISIIGYDWKNQNLSLVDSLAYFVSLPTGSIYKLVFTGYSGIATGNIRFSKTLLPQSTGITENSRIKSLTAYPNPVNDRLNILYTLQEKDDVTIKVVDLAGKTLLAERQNGSRGLNNLTLPAGEFSKGYYFVAVENGSERLTFKFVKAE